MVPRTVETAAEENATRILFSKACHKAFELQKSSLYQIKLGLVNSAPLLSLKEKTMMTKSGRKWNIIVSESKSYEEEN